jgi:tetratricopeptide (TPR) repeat protein
MTTTGIVSPSGSKSKFFIQKCQTSQPARIFILAILFCVAGGLFAQTAFSRGEELFLRNRPREAAPQLEAALLEEPRNEKIYLYLGIAYEQLGNHDRAIALLTRGLEMSIVYRDLFLFNLGNNRLARGDVAGAVEMYSRAVETNGSLSDAYLNRANAEVRLERFEDAVRDYRLYLTMEPGTPQRPQIERMIRLIEGVQADRAARLLEEERRKKEEEENRRIAEERRKQDEERKAAEEERLRREEEERRRVAEERRKQEEDRRRREEEARQKALLEEVLRSLQASSEDAANLSAEKEDIREKREDVDIED